MTLAKSHVREEYDMSLHLKVSLRCDLVLVTLIVINMFATKHYFKKVIFSNFFSTFGGP